MNGNDPRGQPGAATQVKTATIVQFFRKETPIYNLGEEEDILRDWNFMGRVFSLKGEEIKVKAAVYLRSDEMIRLFPEGKSERNESVSQNSIQTPQLDSQP